MKLKTSCYDPAFCRMGFKRFAPVGILYTLVLVLLALANVNMGQNMHSNVIYGLRYFYQITTVVQFGYAFLLAQVLLGDLYTPRLCYAIHSLPVTRGGWFGTQVIQGILSVIPGILLSAGLMAASVTRFRFLIPLWMGVSMLQFLFFFGLALLCGVGAGNRMGMAVLYGIANFFGLVVSWARLKIFAPLIYGMYIPDTRVVLCPLSKLLYAEVFSMEHAGNFVRQAEDGPTAFFSSQEIAKVELVPSSIWLNLFFAALGIVSIFLAMKLLNRRKAECAGDLLAFRKTQPVILVLCTLCAGVVFHGVSSLFGWNLSYLMLALGLVLGYYICLMLMKRQVNVFTPKSLVPLTIMAALTFLSLSFTGLDIAGVTYKLPQAQEVQEVSFRVFGGYHDTFTATTPEDIQKVLSIHADALEEHRQLEQSRPLAERIFGNEEEFREYLREDGTREATTQSFLTYTLKDGSTLCRSYQIHESIPNLAFLQEIFSQPEYVFSGFALDIFSEADVRTLLETTEFIQLECWHGEQDQYGYRQSNTLRIAKEDWDGLLDAMLADCQAGTLGQLRLFHPGQTNSDRIALYYPAIHYEGLDCLGVDLYSDSTNTLNWLVEHGYHDPISDPAA